MGSISSFFVRFAAKIIAVDDTVVPREQLQLLQDMMREPKVELHGRDARKLLHSIARKHMVNGITVLRTNSNIVFSSDGNGTRIAEDASSLFKFLNGNSAGPEAIAVKRNREWRMLLPSNGKLFVVRANSSLSTVELRSIARDIQNALGKRL